MFEREIRYTNLRHLKKKIKLLVWEGKDSKYTYGMHNINRLYYYCYVISSPAYYYIWLIQGWHIWALVADRKVMKYDFLG